MRLSTDFGMSFSSAAIVEGGNTLLCQRPLIRPPNIYSGTPISANKYLSIGTHNKAGNSTYMSIERAQACPVYRFQILIV